MQFMNEESQSSGLEPLKENVQQVANEAKSKAQAVLKKGQTYVRENLIVTVLIGLFISAAMGVIFFGCKQKHTPSNKAKDYLEDLLRTIVSKLH